MAYYNGGFPMSYQQIYPQPNFPTVQNENQINWVQGESGAKSWFVAAGKTALLMDSENSTFYLKSTDQSGMPMPLRIFDYTERTQQKQEEKPEPPKVNLDNYVTREELDQRLFNIMSEINGKKDEENGKLIIPGTH